MARFGIALMAAACVAMLGASCGEGRKPLLTDIASDAEPAAADQDRDKGEDHDD